MKARVALGCSLALWLAACGKPDPFDDPGYAAVCHGLPLGLEGRQQAREAGYVVVARYDCIDKASWVEVQKAQALVADRVAKAQRERQDCDARPAASLAAACQDFHTGISAPASGTPLPKPPPALFVRADYTGGEGRTLAAFVSPDPRDGQRHAAIVWITGGDSSTLEDFWSAGSSDNDQSASAFRQAGVVMMFPTLRGGNTDSGKHEYFYGEVDDIHAAANRLAKLTYVDPARIYLGGHSTGGTLALLAAETGGRFAAVFAFGAVGRVDHYPLEIFPPGAAIAQRELDLRSPEHWLNAITTPTYLVEGRLAPGNAGELDEMCHALRNPQVHCVSVYGSNHFSAIDRVGQLLGPRLEAGTMGEIAMLRTQDFPLELPVR